MEIRDAVLSPIFGAGLCGIPITSESALSSLPYLKPLGPWIADLSGIILTLVLPAIRFKPQARMQSEVVAASCRYDWDTIKLAARRALVEEMTLGRLGREEGDAAHQLVEAFQAVADSRLHSSNKYTALVRHLRWRPFSWLRDGLVAARGTQA